METGNNWEITTDRYVVYIDIMGFKDMVARTPHIEIYELMKRIDEIKKHVESVKWIKDREGLVKTTTYSDSIILYSKDDNYESFDFLVSTTAGLMHYLFIEGIPFKGAVAFGTMTLDSEKSIFFGQPLIDAYLLQDELYYYGVVFHATAESKIENLGHDWPPFTSQYPCDFKGGSTKHMAIYPLYTKQKEDGEYYDKYLKFEKAVNSLRLKTSGTLRKYIDNTERFILNLRDNDKRK
jgi:hypothetical protein